VFYMLIRLFEFSDALNCVNGSELEEPIPDILSLETNSNIMPRMYLNTK